MNVKQVKTGTIKPIQPFQSLAEEAEYWDTHSLVDEIKDTSQVGFHRANKTDTLTIRFDHADLEKLTEEAGQKGIGPSTLARMWIKEKLQTAH